MPKLDLNDVLKQWRLWGVEQAPTLKHQFTTGLNHRVYLIDSAAQTLVLKIFSVPNSDAGRVQTLAAAQGLAPRVVHQDLSGQYCLMEFVTETIRTTKPIMQIAEALARLHQGDFEQGERFDYHAVSQQYLSSLGGGYQGRLAGLESALQAFSSDSSAACFCHNDLVRDNCLVDQERLLFVDWEYAQWNSPWFDLASIVFYFDLSTQETNQLISEYWRLRKTRQAGTGQSLSAALCAVIFLDIVWHAERNQRLGVIAAESIETQKWAALNAAISDFEKHAL